MSAPLIRLRRKNQKASMVPFGIGMTKPHHYAEMMRILWDNRGKWNYAYRILSEGVCDGCALGTTGLHDWTIEGTHLCLVRLNLLRLNTMDAFDPTILEDLTSIPIARPGKLRELGRIGYPLHRRRGEAGFRRISWDDAINEISARMRAIAPERAALYLTSRGITNEIYYVAQKAWRAYGSPHVDNAARLCHSPSTAAMNRTLGIAASTCSYRDWYDADAIVFFGSNPANDQPVALKYLYEAKKRGARVLVVNTYDEPGLERYWIPSTADSAIFGSRIADAFYRVNIGGDQAFVYAVQKLLIDRFAVDREFIERSTEGYYEYRAALDRIGLEELIRRSGATRAAVEEFADELQRARNGVFVWSMGVTQHTHGSDTVTAICCLGLSRGFVGRRGCGLMPIRGHSGVQGGAEMGAYATAFPGGVPVDETNATHLESQWGFRPPDRKGLDAAAMLDAARDGELDLLYSVGGNFLDTMPQPDRVTTALERLRVRVHQDIVLTPQMFVEPGEEVYVLPARTRYEHRGGVTETTTERRIIYSPHVPGHDVGEARDEWEILRDIVRCVRPDRASALSFENTQMIRDEIERVVPRYSGISRLRKTGDQFQWGGERLCEGGQFERPNGRARFSFSEPPDRQIRRDKFFMATRRGKQFNSMVQAPIDGLTGAARDHVFMNSSDMQRLGLSADQPIVVASPHGVVRGRAFPAPISPGNVQLHWPEANPLIDANRRDDSGFVPDYNETVTIHAAG